MLTLQPNVPSTIVFRIFDVTAKGTVSFYGLTITGGGAGSNNGAQGGGIQNAGTGTVNVISSTVTSNGAIQGGGISNSSSGIQRYQSQITITS
jgi:hypothetical protein